VKAYFIGINKSGQDLLKKIPDENLAGHELLGKEPDWAQVKEADCVWFFAERSNFDNIWKKFVELKKTLIINLPQSDLPEGLDSELIKNKLCWVYGPRICLGMNLLSPFIDYLNKGNLFWNDVSAQIHDVGPADELPSPSAIATEWADCVDKNAAILTYRISSNPGVTKLRLSTENESLEVSHRIHDRDAYIQGAMWATYKMLFSNQQKPGLTRFEKLFWQSLENTNIMGLNKFFQV
jgi:hypothetical protein